MTVHCMLVIAQSKFDQGYLLHAMSRRLRVTQERQEIGSSGSSNRQWGRGRGQSGKAWETFSSACFSLACVVRELHVFCFLRSLCCKRRAIVCKVPGWKRWLEEKKFDGGIKTGRGRVLVNKTYASLCLLEMKKCFVRCLCGGNRWVEEGDLLDTYLLAKFLHVLCGV